MNSLFRGLTKSSLDVEVSVNSKHYESKIFFTTPVTNKMTFNNHKKRMPLTMKKQLTSFQVFHVSDILSPFYLWHRKEKIKFFVKVIPVVYFLSLLSARGFYRRALNYDPILEKRSNWNRNYQRLHMVFLQGLSYFTCPIVCVSVAL